MLLYKTMVCWCLWFNVIPQNSFCIYNSHLCDKPGFLIHNTLTYSLILECTKSPFRINNLHIFKNKNRASSYRHFSVCFSLRVRNHSIVCECYLSRFSLLHLVWQSVIHFKSSKYIRFCFGQEFFPNLVECGVGGGGGGDMNHEYNSKCQPSKFESEKGPSLHPFYAFLSPSLSSPFHQ